MGLGCPRIRPAITILYCIGFRIRICDPISEDLWSDKPTRIHLALKALGNARARWIKERERERGVHSRSLITLRYSTNLDLGFRFSAWFLILWSIICDEIDWFIVSSWNLAEILAEFMVLGFYFLIWWFIFVYWYSLIFNRVFWFEGSLKWLWEWVDLAFSCRWIGRDRSGLRCWCRWCWWCSGLWRSWLGTPSVLFGPWCLYTPAESRWRRWLLSPTGRATTGTRWIGWTPVRQRSTRSRSPFLRRRRAANTTISRSLSHHF